MLALALALPALAHAALPSAPAARPTTAEAAAEGAWLRRAALDLTGRLPAASERRALAEAPGDKTRAQLVDGWLATNAFARRWGKLLAAPLVTADPDLATLGRRVEEYLAASLAARKPWPAVARELLTAEGSVDEAPATAFLLQFIEARTEVASRVGSGLMGVRLACAQCHDHPFGPWTVQDFHGLAAWFARTRRMDLPRDLYRVYRAGRLADVSAVDISLPDGAQSKMTRDRLQRLGRDLAVLNRHPIGGPPRAREKSHVEMELLASPAPTASVMATAVVTDLSKTVAVLVEEGDEELPLPEVPALPGALTVTLPKVSGRAMPPRLPGVDAKPPRDPSGGRRTVLADWLTAPDNPFLARAVVNRVFLHLTGHPLIEPVDGVDLAGPDPARTAELASWSSRFAAHPDVAALIREVVLSPGYRSPSTRPLDAAQIAGALESGLEAGEVSELARALARQTRERADDGSVDARERLATPLDLPAALAWVSGAELDRAIARSGLVSRLRDLPAAERTAALIAALLCRPPTPDERARLAPFTADPPAPARLADAVWAIVASAEFLSQR